MPSIIQPDDGSLGISGADAGKGPFVNATGEWIATSVDKIFFVAARAMRVQGITARVRAAGTDAGAVTAAIMKVPSGTAIASGTILHSGTINLKGTADTNQALTLVAADCDLAAGEALGIDFTGTLTAATGAVTVAMSPR